MITCMGVNVLNKILGKQANRLNSGWRVVLDYLCQRQNCHGLAGVLVPETVTDVD